MSAHLIVEADGGSRGNPGPAGFGSVVIDAATGEVLAEKGETIGTATNNVAEYRGLIGGLELALNRGSDASIEVRMDSKLVIEQMAGRWEIKHPDMKPLAMEAQALARQFRHVTWTWVPREQNKRADALVNLALDAQAAGSPETTVGATAQATVTARPEPEATLFDDVAAPSEETPAQGWRPNDAPPTRLFMVRHGVTEMTERKVFSGTGGEDPALTSRGLEQAARAADYLKNREQIDLVVASPLLRTRQTAETIARLYGADVLIDEGFTEANFGAWDGHSFGEIMAKWPEEMNAWLSRTDVAPPGGESFDEVRARVDAARQRLVSEHAGKRIVVASHVTPIKLVVREAIDAPMTVLYTLEVAPASITTTSWWPDGNKNLSNFSVEPGPVSGLSS
ncbi:MAG: bifunctional RNase H/acid phosphatase [Aeromicrobium sp.]|nr:MAG: bifunctional RNase H/acid phosphatase [Aeromicrobium sp.]